MWQDHSAWGSVKHFADPPVLVEPSSLRRIDAVVENELGLIHLKDQFLRHLILGLMDVFWVLDI